MKTEQRKGSIMLQVAALFLVGILTTGIFTYVSEQKLSTDSVLRRTEGYAADLTEEVKASVLEYPAYHWLISYWYSHADGMDVEYDAELNPAARTAAKCRLFTERHPELQLRYMTAESLKALPPEDQQLYAEIAYSWLVTRINQIKRTYHVDYLFCVITEAPYDKQFFLFSGAEPGAVRGTRYEEVYPLGHTVTVTESQQEAMRQARRYSSHLADAGDYMDYYAYLCSFDEHSVLIGLTYDLSALRADVKEQTLTGAALAILNQLALSLVCLALIYFFVLRPLKRVQRSIRAYKQTKDSAAVSASLAEVRSRNEIGVLSEDVVDLAREIDEYLEQIRSITAEKERIGTELELATRIQAAMLPSTFPAFPGRTEFDIYASMDPAKEVGGDFYDFFLTDPDHLCLVIADVSGKGVPAALFMMASKIILANNAMMGKSPAQILTDTNAAICSNNREEMFVTVWLGILELSTGKLTCANAGHEYPTLKHPDGSFALWKDRHGFVIGGMEGVRYRSYELQLEPGSKLFVYTDGVPEATDGAEQLFGTERMLKALNDAADRPPQQILHGVRAAVDAFVGEAEQFDDLTMLCLEYRGPGNVDAP